MRRPFFLATFLAFCVVSLGLTASAVAGGKEAPVVHPLYSHVPGAAENPVADREFKAAAARYRLGPVQTIDVPTPPPPKTGDRIKSAIASLANGLKFDDALRELEAAAQEVATTGGEGLEPIELGTLYLHRGWARQRATFKTDAAAPTPPEALGDYVRAHVAYPEMHITSRNFPPAVVAGWDRAVAEVRKRPRGTLTVHAVDGQVILNGHRAMPAPAVFPDLPYAEYVVRIERPGRPDWGEVVPIAAPALVIEPEAPAPLTLDDALAAAEARRMGAKFALVGEPRVGADRMMLDLRLVDATTGKRRDATTANLAGERGAVDSAVMRLDEQARGVDLARARGLEAAPQPPVGPAPPAPASPVTPASTTAPASPPTPAPGGAVISTAPPPSEPVRYDQNPVGWGKQHWPLLTACAVFAGSALFMTLSVANSGR